MIRKKSNYQIAVSSLTAAHSSHYDGVHAIYRLAAFVPISDETSLDGIHRQVKRLKKELEVLPVRANRINISNNMLEIDFYPKGFQMVMTKGQYTGLQLEFAKFLDESGIFGITIQDGCYDDDPDDTVKAIPNDQINFFPEFNSECFGTDSEIEVLNFYRGVR